jgi:hypothetical protein
MVRDEVASRLDEQNYTFVDDYVGNPKLERIGEENWWEGPDDCGYDGHAYWTYSITDPDDSTNEGRWRPNLPESGAYRVFVYVPYCINGIPDSTGVHYQIYDAEGVTTTVTVNQKAVAGGWVDLGLYNFNAGTSGYVFLSDIADDNYKTIWFDTIKWFREGESTAGTLPPNNLHPANHSWSSSRTVAFQWSASPTEGVDEYQIIIATNPELADPIKVDNVDYSGTDWVYPFGDDYSQVYWGVKALGPNGYSPPSGPWELGIDTVAPTAAISGVYLYPDGHYSVHWDGQDATSGIAAFDVEYRQGTGDWTPWLTQTTAQGAPFPYPVTETVSFQVRATDIAGNQGDFGDEGMSTDSAILLDRQVYFPLTLYNWPPEP